MRKIILSTNLQSKVYRGGKEEATPYALGTDVRYPVSFPPLVGGN
ncbi:hypothetical protein ASZ90_007589 [hydrocarbon metagenome]|uniref:Uncharacterized protein n=1 Tax=hydrocarbon metagenome TaxID=938273 RepID=A0A0W8FPU0_9ZZZZ